MPVIPSSNQSLQAPGAQVSGSLMSPGDITVDFVVQGFLTPAGGSLTGTMSSPAWPSSGTGVAVAYASGSRVFKESGDSALTFTYTASRDTYDDIDIDGTIYHTAVTNGAAAPSLATPTCLRLQKVVTNASAITSVSQLANNAPKLKQRYESSQQAITAGGILTLVHGFSGSIPRRIWYDLVCATAELGYTVGQRVAAQTVTGKNGAGPGLTIVANSSNLNIRFNNGSPVFQICNFTTGAQVNITNANWRVVFYAEL